MIIGFTGTQKGMTKYQKEMIPQILKLKNATEFIHGDCIGADAEVNQIALDYGIKIFTLYPSTIERKRAWCFNSPVTGDTFARIRKPQPPLIRNKQIVDNCHWLIACPKEFEHTLRSGTWATIRYAWKIKRDLTIIPPVEREE